MTNFDELLEEYWNLAYKEGRESRSHDTEAGDAQRVLSAIQAALRALRAELEAERSKALIRERGKS